MAKEKKNIFKKIARMNSKNKNDSNDLKNQNNDKNNKTVRIDAKTKKTIIKTSIGLAVISLGLGLGIGLPLKLSSNNSSSVIEKRNANDILIKITAPDNKVLELTSKDFENGLKTSAVISKEKLEDAKKTLVKYLYEEEVKWSKIFQKAWENTNGENTYNNSRKFSILSYEDLKKEEEKFLSDERRRYQKTFQYDNWESEFNKYLTTDSKFGGATTFERAVEHLVYNKMKDVAFARFQIKISNDFKVKDIKNRILKEDIKDEDGKIVFAKDSNLFDGIINLTNDSSKNKKQNAFAPNIDNPSSSTKTAEEKQKESENASVSVILTKSYVKEWMNPTNILNKFYFENDSIFKDQFKFNDISQLTLNLLQDEQNSEAAWKVSKDTLKELLRYQIISFNDSSENPTTNSVKTTLELLENFKGATNNSDANQKQNDKILLNTVNNSVNKSKANFLGRLPLKTINDIFEEESVAYASSFLKDIYTEKETTNILKVDLFNKIKEILFKGNENLLPESSTLTNKTAEKITEINTKIINFIDKLSDGELTKAGEAVRDVFGKDDPTKRVSTIYKLNNDAKIVFSTKGLTILLNNKIDSLEKFEKLANEQLQLHANKQYDQKIEVSLQLDSIFNDVRDENFILKDLIKTEQFKNILFEKHMKNKTEEEKQKYIGEISKNLDLFINSYKISQVVKINNKVGEYLQKIMKNNLNKDYEYNNTLQHWIIKGKETKSAQETIYDALLKEFNIKKEGEN